ncbi:transcriptional regulator [Devosia pacifica]|uniref:Transcriptional regulator n=1 Tax=Devosia pacifica TaxID=1335967 RepID=A0A918S382_9HYPH|nr:metalloregulator ArsR/SmtB family transcription factor [Devosia pacifica]GHA18577.1 transcriptional regulator [Devosia pacifica]
MVAEDTALSDESRIIQSRLDEATSFLKKLANRDRLMVVCALVEGERSVRELEDLLQIRQPGLSQQLAELRAAGMIEGRKQGKAVYYSLSDPRAKALIGTMYELFCGPDAV